MKVLQTGDFGVLQEIRFVIRTDWFLLGINFCNFQKVLSTQQNLTIFSFLLSMCNRNKYFQTINQTSCDLRTDKIS